MMNPLDWEDSVRRWQISVNTHQKDSGRMENTCGTHGSQTYYQHRADTVEHPPNSLLTVHSGSAEQCPSTNTFHMEKAELFDTDQEDHELTRKLKELRKIEASMRGKKVAVACKTVLEPSLAASGEESDRCAGPTLKDRVNAVLQQRQSNSFLSKSHFHKRRIKSSGPSKDDTQQEDHPLKMRVNALMKHRTSRPCVSPSNTKLPPQRILSSPAEESSIDQGFRRFLDVLNKGVDVNFLRRIVNDDSEDLCSDDKVRDKKQREATHSPFRSESRYSNDVISPEHSGSGERSTEPRRKESSPSNLIPDDDDDENKEEALSPFRSKTSSDSPSGIKCQKEDEDRIKHNEQHEQLQNILKSLGLQLEVEEISKLANRTQERLYGKKTDNVDAESRREPDRQPRHSPRSNRSSSSSSSSRSSSSSSSSRSSSRSRSSSSSSCGSSQSKASGRRRTSESSSSRERSSEKLPGQENNQGREKRLKVSNEDETQIRDRHSYAQNQTCPPPNPSYSFPSLPDYTLAQYSQYSSYSTNPYQDAMSSYWTYSQVPVYPSFYPSSHPYTQDERPQFPQFPIAVLEHTRHLPHQAQKAQPLDQWCLKAIHRNPVNNCVEGKRTNKKTKKLHSRKNPVCRKQKRTKEKLKRAEEEVDGDQQPAPKKEEQVNQVEKSHDSVTVHHNSKAVNSKKLKHRLTEEEIKANLRKTLEAFNRKVKQGVNQPLSSLTCQTDEDLLMKL